jgi:hypothetical protein
MKQRGSRGGAGFQFVAHGAAGVDMWYHRRLQHIAVASTKITQKLPFMGKMHKMTLQPNYFTSLTLLCDVLATDATPVYAAPMGAAPHIIGRQAQAATYDRMCGVCVTPLRREPHKRVRNVK